MYTLLCIPTIKEIRIEDLQRATRDYWSRRQILTMLPALLLPVFSFLRVFIVATCKTKQKKKK